MNHVIARSSAKGVTTKQSPIKRDLLLGLRHPFNGRHLHLTQVQVLLRGVYTEQSECARNDINKEQN